MLRRILGICLTAVLMIALCSCGEKPQVKPAVSTAPSAGISPLTPAPEAVSAAPMSDAPSETLPDGVAYTNVLLLGSFGADFKGGDSTDASLTTIVLTLDPAGRMMKFTTFPYNLNIDVYAGDGLAMQQIQEIGKSGGADKIAFFIGRDFGIKIDYWVQLNMRAMIDIIDALNGIDIDIRSLTVNDTASDLKMLLGIAWEKISKTGIQKLSGVQAAGYFLDTHPLTADWLKEEELSFRDRHSAIIVGVTATVRALGLDSEDLIKIADNVKGNYITNIPDDAWRRIAETALYCSGAEPQFLYIPEVIEPYGSSEYGMIYDKDTDVAAVKAFVGSK